MSKDQEVYKRLIDNVYIHSNTDNFSRYVSANYGLSGFFGRSTKVDNEMRKAKTRLLDAINTITKICNAFYQDMGLLKRDRFDADTGIFYLDGAEEFQLQYLMKTQDQLEESDSTSTKILSIMNSPEYINVLIASMERNISFNSSQFQAFIQEAARGLSENVVSSMIDPVINTTGPQVAQAAFDALSKMFQTTKKANNRSYLKKTIQANISKSLSKKGLAARIYEAATKEGLSATRKADLDKIKQNIVNQFILNYSHEEIAKEMWNTLIQLDTKKVVNENLKDIFIQYFKQALDENYSKVDLIKDKAQLSGAILEQGFLFGISYDVKKVVSLAGNEFISMGQTNVKKTFQTMKGPMVITAASGTDIQVRGKSGQIYNIQAKNSFSNKDYTSIHLQSEISLYTYAHTVLSEERANELEYMVLNRAYLNQYGSYGLTEDVGNHLYRKSDSLIDLYIEYFLNETLAYLVAGKITKGTGTTNKNYYSKANVLFLYKGKFLIPTSIFLYSAYELISQLIDKDPRELDNAAATFGFLNVSQELKGVNVGKEEAGNLKLQKILALEEAKKDWKKKELKDLKRYPPQLMSVGSDFGKSLLQKAAFKRMTYTLKIKKIEELLNNVR